MPAAELDQVMTRFADGEADILLSTNIVESGIDIPSANTMIIHRADMFGLSQLYQLRGRVGRGRQRAYAYLTSDPNRLLTPHARHRLEVMQTLDTLGAGFTLASYDMDIRGAGNLLGDEQSGHVRGWSNCIKKCCVRRLMLRVLAAMSDETGAMDATDQSWC